MKTAGNTVTEIVPDPEINDNALTWAANADKARTQPNDSSGEGSSLVRGVDVGGLQSHALKRVERLEALWKQASKGADAAAETPASELLEAVTEPTRRSRTPLTPDQIDAIHTARDSGESVTSITRRFAISRMTVWEKAKSHE